MAGEKRWQVPIGGRGAEGVDAVGEIMRHNLVNREEKKMKRDDELEELQHKSKVEEYKGEGKKEAEPLVKFKGMEIDLQKGQKDAEDRAKAAEAQSVKDRESSQETQKTLERERIDTMTAGFTKEMGDLKKMIESGKDNQSISDKVEEIQKTATALGWGPQQPSTQVPPDIQVKLQQMQIDMQFKLSEMEDERHRRDKEWDVAQQHRNDEKEFRRAELAQKAAADAERTQLMRGGMDGIGKIIGKTLVEEKGVGSQSPKQFSIEAGAGEEGNVECPACATSIFLPPDANKIMCPGCGSTGMVKRIADQKAEETESIL